MGLGERRLHRSTDLGRCRWPRETPRRQLPAKAGDTGREVKSPEGRIPRALHPEIRVGGEMGSKPPRESELRRRKVPGEESPGQPNPFHRKRCRERNPRRGTAGNPQGSGKAGSGRHPGGERRPREDGGDISRLRRRGLERNTRWTTSRERREGRTGNGKPMRRYALGQ